VALAVVRRGRGSHWCRGRRVRLNGDRKRAHEYSGGNRTE
jgi:hypothetical protein